MNSAHHSKLCAGPLAHKIAVPLLLLVASVGVTPLVADDAGAAPAPIVVTGTFLVVWGDPYDRSQPAQQRCFIDDGEKCRALDIDATTLARAGGAWALNRQTVTVRGHVPDARAAMLAVDQIVAETTAIPPPGQRPVLAERVSGSQPFVWILLRFADVASTPEVPSWFTAQALGPAPSLDHFWREVSFDQIDIDGSQVYGWFDLPHNRSHYVYDVDPDEPGDELDFDRALHDAVAVADDQVYFPQFQGINLVFNDDLDGPSWGGVRLLFADFVPKIYGVTWMPPWGWGTQAVLEHEMGHAFGLPHASGPYGQDYDSEWALMSDSGGTCAVTDPEYGCLGQHTIAYHKDMLDWIPSHARFTVSDGPQVIGLIVYNLALPAPSGYRHIVRIPKWSTDPSHFFTVELRRWTGYDENVPRNAVLIHDVDPARENHAHVVDADDDGDCNDEGAVWETGESFFNPANNIIVTVEWTDTNTAGLTITNAARPTVYVDSDASGSQDGSSGDPWDTLWEGHGAVDPHGTVYLDSGWYAENLLLRKPAVLRRWGSSGTVVIGD